MFFGGEDDSDFSDFSDGSDFSDFSDFSDDSDGSDFSDFSDDSDDSDFSDFSDNSDFSDFSELLENSGNVILLRGIFIPHSLMVSSNLFVSILCRCPLFKVEGFKDGVFAK